MKKLMLSFKYAIIGVHFCIKTCRNFRIHTVVAAYVLYFCSFYNFDKATYAVLLSLILFVLISETLNTAIEQTCDAQTTNMNEHIKHAKDVSAGAVLLSTICSFVIGIYLFFDLSIIMSVIRYFSSPLRLALLVLSAVISIFYIFYKDIFKNESN